MREIAQLQEMQTAVTDGYIPAHLGESGLTAELDTLRERKMELETRMHQMQETRRELMQQLEHLMRVLKVPITVNIGYNVLSFITYHFCGTRVHFPCKILRL